MYNDVIPRKRPKPQQSQQQQQPSPPTPTTAPAEHAAQPSKKPRKKREGWRSVLTTIAILLLAPLFALLLTAYVFQTYQVDGPSMKNTLQPSDRLIVWKAPRTWAQITGTPYLPERSDIIVFSEPRLGQFGQSPGKQLIKRVVALPGERVIIEEGVLTVYNDEHPQGFSPDEQLPPGTIAGSAPETLDTTIPENHVFVAGDNRANSLDSRAFGPVHVDNIIGDLTFRVLPINNAQKF